MGQCQTGIYPPFDRLVIPPTCQRSADATTRARGVKTSLSCRSGLSVEDTLTLRALAGDVKGPVKKSGKGSPHPLGDVFRGRPVPLFPRLADAEDAPLIRVARQSASERGERFVQQRS